MTLTVNDLIEIMKKNNIPMDAKLTSDSGWECGATDVSSVFYDKDKNEIVLCQDYPNLEHRLWQIALIPGERTMQNGWRFDYYVDAETKIVMRKDKRP